MFGGYNSIYYEVIASQTSTNCNRLTWHDVVNVKYFCHITVHDVYWDVIYPEYLHVRNRLYSSTLYTHIPFPLTYAFYAYPFPPYLRILRVMLHNFFEHKYQRIKSLCCKSCTS